jgi:hypothetical protein
MAVLVRMTAAGMDAATNGQVSTHEVIDLHAIVQP